MLLQELNLFLQKSVNKRTLMVDVRLFVFFIVQLIASCILLGLEILRQLLLAKTKFFSL